MDLGDPQLDASRSCENEVDGSRLIGPAALPQQPRRVLAATVKKRF